MTRNKERLIIIKVLAVGVVVEFGELTGLQLLLIDIKKNNKGVT